MKRTELARKVKAEQRRDLTGWRPSDYTTGPLEGIPALVVLPSVRLAHAIRRREASLLLAESFFWQQWGTLELIEAGRLHFECDGPDGLPPEALARLTDDEANYYLADEVGPEREQM